MFLNTAQVVWIAAQRLAISRARQTEVDMLDRESLGMPPAAKIAPTEGVGCMAVLGRN